MRLLLLWILNAVALLLVTYLLPSIQVSGFGTALIAALVLGFINTLVRPVLAILTLPITVLTLGVFYLVLNGLLFWLASALLPGFQVAGFVSALLGALLERTLYRRMYGKPHLDQVLFTIGLTFMAVAAVDCAVGSSQQLAQLPDFLPGRGEFFSRGLNHAVTGSNDRVTGPRGMGPTPIAIFERSNANASTARNCPSSGSTGIGRSPSAGGSPTGRGRASRASWRRCAGSWVRMPCPSRSPSAPRVKYLSSMLRSYR